MKAYSFRQMQDAGIRVDNYKANEREGVFIATLDVKRWGKGRNILAYFTFEDGSKIMAAVWQNTGYLGLPDIEEGARLKLTFERAKNGSSYLRKAKDTSVLHRNKQDVCVPNVAPPQGFCGRDFRECP